MQKINEVPTPLLSTSYLNLSISPAKLNIINTKKKPGKTNKQNLIEIYYDELMNKNLLLRMLQIFTAGSGNTITKMTKTNRNDGVDCGVFALLFISASPV